MFYTGKSIELPSFTEEECIDEIKASKCIKITLPSGESKYMSLNVTSESSIVYEGFLHGDEDVSVVMVQDPEEHDTMVKFYEKLKGRL